MVTTLSKQETTLRRAPRRLHIVHWLAIIGIPILVWEGWTVTAWLADGPEPIRGFTTGRTLDWYGARFFEGLTLIVGIAVLIEVIRGCRRAGKILTFDVMFCICGATLFWADLGVNFFQPVLAISSNWVNVNSTCGHMPFVVNPDCGRVPDPILFFLLVEAFGALGAAMALGAVTRWVRRRSPGITTAKLVWILIGLSALIAGPFEILMIALHTWTYASAPFALPLGKGMLYPILPELLGFTCWIFIFSALRIFRNDLGQTLVERGLERHSPRVAKAITMLAMYSLMQVVTWGPATVPDFLLGVYAQPWPKLPAQIVNNACDAPGIESTRYGPCPGSPGYRMPGRTSGLPGEPAR